MGVGVGKRWRMAWGMKEERWGVTFKVFLVHYSLFRGTNAQRWRVDVAQGGTGDRMISSGIGRDVIAITSVGGRMSKGSVTLPGSTHARKRTAVMAMTALPNAPANFPVSGLPLSPSI